MVNNAIRLENSWKELLKDQFEQPYFLNLSRRLHNERNSGAVIYPPGPLIFNAMELCPVQQVRLVILGQDPYPNPGQAHGLCFSVPPEVPPPRSLINIFRELCDDLHLPPPPHGCLEAWARQGVLLLNTCLTVGAYRAASHFGWGWETFTDTIISRISTSREQLVFFLWGNPARNKKNLIASNRGHLILETSHPSPLSAHRGFLGCRHFSQANTFLGDRAIEWNLGALTSKE